MSVFKARIEEGKIPLNWVLKDVEEVDVEQIPEEFAGVMDDPDDHVGDLPTIYAGGAKTEDEMYAEIGTGNAEDKLIVPEGFVVDGDVAYIRVDRDKEFLEGRRMFSV